MRKGKVSKHASGQFGTLPHSGRPENQMAIPPHPLQCMICRDCSGPRCDKSQQSCHQIPLFTWCKLQNCPEILQTHLGWVSSNVPSSRNYMKPLATKDRHNFYHLVVAEYAVYLVCGGLLHCSYLLAIKIKTACIKCVIFLLVHLVRSKISSIL